MPFSKTIDTATKLGMAISKLTKKTITGSPDWWNIAGQGHSVFSVTLGKSRITLSMPIGVTLKREYDLDLYVDGNLVLSVCRNKYCGVDYYDLLDDLHNTVRLKVFRSDEKLDELLTELDKL